MKLRLSILVLPLYLFANPSQDSISRTDAEIKALKQEIEYLGKVQAGESSRYEDLIEFNRKEYEGQLDRISGRIDLYLAVVTGFMAIIAFFLNFFGRKVILEFLNRETTKILEVGVNEKLKADITDEWLKNQVKEKAEKPLREAVDEIKENFKELSHSAIREAKDRFKKQNEEANELLAKMKGSLDNIGSENEDLTEEEKEKIDEQDRKLEEKEENEYTSNDWFLKGQSEFNKENYEGAIDFYSKSLILNPNHQHAWNNRATAKSYLKDYEGELSDALRAIEVNPSSSAYNNIGFAKKGLGNFEESIYFFNKSIDKDSRNIYAYLNRGAAYVHLEDYQQAIQDFKSIIDIDPDFSSAYGSLGKTYGILKDFEKSVDAYKKAIERSEDNFVYLNDLGYTYNQILQYELALQCLNKAIEVNPDKAHPYAHRAYAYVMLNKLAESKADNEKALELDPKYGRPYFNIGLIAKKENENTEACIAWEKALELGFEEAQLKLDEFCSKADQND